MADSNPLLPFPIRSKPGIKRDGTQFEGDYYVDGQWNRFDVTGGGLPCKIGGCQVKTSNISGVPRGIDVLPTGGFSYFHVGSSSALERFTIDNSGAAGVVYDRTPTSGFTASSNNLWQFDQLFDSVSVKTTILAHAGQNLSDIDSDVATPVFYGDYTGITAPSSISASSVSGGVCAVGPFMFYYGSGGFIGWSDVNKPTTLSGGLAGTTNQFAQKVVKGMPIRGGVGNSPAGIFWSLDSVLLASFVTGGTVTFDFDTLSHSSSVLSSSCFVEDDGVFYWIGVDRFLMFNGIVQENENDLNKNDFFSNLNYNQRQKVFGFKIPRWGEICWCYPRGSSTEANWMIIYNRRLSKKLGYPVWYDTPLVPGDRASAYFAQVYQYPVMGGTTADPITGKYKIWQHEWGTDTVDNFGPPRAIPAFFETGDVSPTVMQGVNKPNGLHCEYIAPDFVQSGDMRFTLRGRNTARGPTISADPLDFAATAATPQAQFLYPKTTLNQMRFRFESNTVGGNYFMGQPLAYLRLGDGRNIT